MSQPGALKKRSRFCFYMSVTPPSPSARTLTNYRRAGACVTAQGTASNGSILSHSPQPGQEQRRQAEPCVREAMSPRKITTVHRYIAEECRNRTNDLRHRCHTPSLSPIRREPPAARETTAAVYGAPAVETGQAKVVRQHSETQRQSPPSPDLARCTSARRLL